jgi:hypothetical protein
MTIVLVHGNPETEAIWDDLVPHLRGDDVVRLSPPGFGSVIPPGFDCSTDVYRDWLASELTKSPQPIDLPGRSIAIRMTCPPPRQTGTGADRDGRFLLRPGDARAPFCRARRGKGGHLKRCGSLADVPATKTRS